VSRIKIYTNESVDIAIDNKAVLFTHDTDFLGLAARWIEDDKIHSGIIYSHQNDYGIGECIRRLKFFATILTAEDMINHIEFL